MTQELFWLVLSTALTGLLWIPYILDRTAVRGIMGAFANPSPDLPRQSAWAERLKAAHYNSVENLVVFAVLVLVLSDLGISSGMTVFAAALFFWSRLAYVIVYMLGIPVARTLAFLAGFAAQAMLLLALL